MEFRRAFKTLTGFPALRWQLRLFDEYLSQGEIPAAVDIPTGLGKTAVMALWLIARSRHPRLPRRLVYVVDRKAVVDQATEFAASLRVNLDTYAHELKSSLNLDGRSLPISTLRGQFVDNREWLEDPSVAAIIVGTVDMIGSRLLFEGYGVSRKMRPYHAGLLGADTLVVLDEAHLVPPFERLLETIESQSDLFGAQHKDDRKVVPPFRLLSLSATGRARKGSIFRFDEEQDIVDSHTEKVFKAPKKLYFVDTDNSKLETMLAEQAWGLARGGTNPIRCVVFCNERRVAERVKAELDKRTKPKKKSDDQKAHTELFVGARRVFEREGAARKLKELGFLGGSTVERIKPVFLVATSAAEVGVDLDADHMACDLVAWERMVQRLGRVNRRGKGKADIFVVAAVPQPSEQVRKAYEKSEKDRTKKDKQKIELFEAYLAKRRPLEALQRGEDGGTDVSPRALCSLKIAASAGGALQESLGDATSPEPLRPALTRPLVDAWSMTSLKHHTGRPTVGPWLRGWIEEDPQTVVVWRRFLPVRVSGSQPTEREVEAFFEAAPPHLSEQLETETHRVRDWLLARVATLNSGDQSVESPSLDHPVAFVLSRAGDLRYKITLRELVETKQTKGPRKRQITEDLDRQLAHAILIVDARLAGLRDGLLNEDENEPPLTADGEGWILNQYKDASYGNAEDASSRPLVPFRIRLQSTDQDVEQESYWRERRRFDLERTAEGEPARWLIIEKWRHEAATEDDRSTGRPQALDEHQVRTEKKARVLGERLSLTSEYVEMLVRAARLHDEGKRAKGWQHAFSAPRDGVVYAKTKGPFIPSRLDGYRHEFGSLLRAAEDHRYKQLPMPLQDLTLHLIAAHHGFARPLIATDGCEDAPPSKLVEKAREVALRFVRLQKRWGPWGLAWWEALLRAADQQASRDNDAGVVIYVEEAS